MAEIKSGGETPMYKPYVAPEMSMKEFTIRALIIGLVMSVILGAANAYLGLKAGMTIAATYPAAVIGMALLRIMRGSILEENFARTVGSIGESVAAGAIFTLPAFYIAEVAGQKIWPEFATTGNYLKSTAIMAAGGVLGIMFVALLRRVMVEDRELPFPESVAAGEIHKAGRAGGTGAKFLFSAMGAGALIQGLGQFKFFATTWEKFVTFVKTPIGLRSSGEATAQGGMLLSSPGISPAYIGVGYIIGPKLASLNFSGGLLAWGLFVPIILYFLGPYIDIAGMAAKIIEEAAGRGSMITPEEATIQAWVDSSKNIWSRIVRPIAIGGMLMSAAYTLFRMRKSLAAGLSRSISDVKKSAAGVHVTLRTEQDLKFNWVMLGILVSGVATFFIYNYFAKDIVAALVATVVMIVAGFFFAAVSGYLVGIIGSSNNPISGLTLSTLLIAALLMVILGMKGIPGVAAVLGVAGVVCVAAAVAGEMLQDLKVGHILGGTPWKMQVGDLFGIALAAVVMFLPLIILHEGDIKAGQMADPPYQGGFGGPKLPAPQASLMAMLSQGIVGGTMSWPLIIVGMFMGLGFILMQVRSPMLVSVGMYLPLETTFAIFIGGVIKGIVEQIGARKKLNEAQKARVENTGVLLASGLIAGEALIGLLFAGLAFADVKLFAFFKHPSFITSLVVLGIIGWILVQIPMKNAGRADEPAPPSGVF
ncbi:MAG: oligopeptide transporter, OPT family [candidate division KSB1 bacterium]|nr:oligopeptide transporter, OPT family [candidate division KSB1 bacterium]MDZ7302798.1 oligopeptide transporter, OPT family [candidate division KSB1 bacterium]MDZ7310037.1 oligopeptide transporter, OPT family [candidate division KSB1 bacterium]